MLKRYRKIIQEINSFDFSMLDDSDLSAIMDEFRADLRGGKSPADILPCAFAVIREVADRRLGIWKLFDGNLDAGTLSKFDKKFSSFLSADEARYSPLKRGLGGFLTPPINSRNIAKTCLTPLQEIYNVVQEKRESVDDSQIHLEASFYKAVREMRQPGDGLAFWPYDVQLMGALALYDGKIAEMGTGEGKTVVAVFPACLWALTGKKVHIATVNDYLALRDCEWMRPVFRFLGFSVDCVLSHMPDVERRQAYKADIVYGNNYEFGFDYLRDNTKDRLENRVQSKLGYVIIDEIDSILMDEATTPLIISGASESYSSSYWNFRHVVELLLDKQDELVERLLREAKVETDSRMRFIKLIQTAKADPWNAELLNYISDNRDASRGMRAIESSLAAARSEYKLEDDLFYVVDEKRRTVKLTDRGMNLIEQELGSGFMTLGNTNIERGEELRNFMQLIRAYILHRRDDDYIVHNGGIVIVDEFTGRLSFGKKYEEGLHQAIECKEGLQITPENRVMGRITHPNYFRLYEKMVGMTATAHTEAQEFRKLYNLDVVRIPTNEPVVRVDLPDRFYRTEEEKLEAVIEDIEDCHSSGVPVLVGTRSVEKSEHLSALLEQRGIPHNTLNAKNHAQEAEIIKSAGQPHAVTIATNMAGRGTDIVLGDPNLGLHVIGTERHGARRIDLQLRGRSGRQGDPGSSRFYLSLQDDLFRIFGREEMSAIVKAFDRSRSRDLERLTYRAQQKSEEMSYHIRRHLVERDDIADIQRRAIYRMREEILTGEWTKERVQSLIADHVADLIDCEQYVDEERPADNWNLDELTTHCMTSFGVHIPGPGAEMSIEEIQKAIAKAFEETYDRRERALGANFSRKLGKAVMVDVLETAWADYLSFQSEFDRSLSLRIYARGDALTDYRMESARLFDDLLVSIRREALRDIFTYPLPGERVDSIRSAELNKPISKHIKELLSVVK